MKCKHKIIFLFPSQAVHCHLFMSFFFSPSLFFPIHQEIWKFFLGAYNIEFRTLSDRTDAFIAIPYWVEWLQYFVGGYLYCITTFVPSSINKTLPIFPLYSKQVPSRLALWFNSQSCSAVTIPVVAIICQVAIISVCRVGGKRRLWLDWAILFVNVNALNVCPGRCRFIKSLLLEKHALWESPLVLKVVMYSGVHS